MKGGWGLKLTLHPKGKTALKEPSLIKVKG